MRKRLKVKDEASRIALVKLIVEKRVQFLEYLGDLHRIGDGVLWMGAVRLSRQDVARYFRPPVTAQTVREIRLAMEGPSPSGELSSCEIVVPMPATSSYSHSTSESWLATNLPCFISLAVSLAELLQAPLHGMEFVECFYALLLELDLRFATSAASKALALRNLRNHRHQITWLTEATLSSISNSHNGGMFANSALETDGLVKYLFLNSMPFAYLPAAATLHYEEVIVLLCPQLTMAYRRLGDLDVACNEEYTKRILSIDRRLQLMFFGVVSKELGKLARLKLMQQTWLLSADGLFNGVGDGTTSSTRNLLRELLQSRNAATGGHATGAHNKDIVSAHMVVDSDEAMSDEEL